MIEALCYAATLILLFHVLRQSTVYTQAGLAGRAAFLGFFLAASQFPVLWIFPWSRPETLPTALYLATVVALVQARWRGPGTFGTLFFALAASSAQSLLRAEVPVVMGAAVVAFALFSRPIQAQRRKLIPLGLICIVTGALVQLYLQRIAYPHAVYPPDTPKIQLLQNLNPIFPPNHIPIFLIAITPLVVSFVLLRRFRLLLEPVDELALLACVLYMPLWLITGLVSEVRVYVPFLLLAAPTIAKIFTSMLLTAQREA